MMTPNLPNIAVCGQLRAGKNAAADYLRDQYGYTQFAFGDALKDDFHRRYPEIPREPKPRIGYQNHGQLMRALLGEDVWVRKCFAKIDGISAEEMYADEPFRAVITDVRQLNEFERCRAEGYVIIRITAPEEVRIARAKEAGDNFETAALEHETERHVGNFAVDYEIDNSGSLADLHAQIDAIMAQLKAGEAEVAA